MKKFRITLTERHPRVLDQRLPSGRGPARKLAHIRILLKADDGLAGPAWTDEAISAALDVGPSIVG